MLAKASDNLDKLSKSIILNLFAKLRKMCVETHICVLLSSVVVVVAAGETCHGASLSRLVCRIVSVRRGRDAINRVSTCHYMSSIVRQTGCISYFDSTLCFIISTFLAKSSGLKFFFCLFTSATTAVLPSAFMPTMSIS